MGELPDSIFCIFALDVVAKDFSALAPHTDLRKVWGSCQAFFVGVAVGVVAYWLALAPHTDQGRVRGSYQAVCSIVFARCCSYFVLLGTGLSH